MASTGVESPKLHARLSKR